MAKEVELALDGGLAGGEGGVLGDEAVESGELGGVGEAGWGGGGEGIEEVELLVVREEGLVVVWAVEIDEEIAKGFEDGEGGGGGVDELAIGAGGGEGALEDEGAILAGLGTGVLDAGVDGGGVIEMEGGLDRAGIRAGADEGFIGALADEELESADDDGLAGAGLARDGGEAGGESPLEVLDEREIADAEGGEHCGHAGIMQTWRAFFKPMRTPVLSGRNEGAVHLGRGGSRQGAKAQSFAEGMAGDWARSGCVSGYEEGSRWAGR